MLRARQDALELQIAKLQQQRQGLSEFFENPQTVQRRQRAAYLNSLIQQRAFPWIKIFMDLERILPEGVRVVSIEPKLAGDNVQLTVLVGAMSDESKLKFLKALEKFAGIFAHRTAERNAPDQGGPDRSRHALASGAVFGDLR